MTQGTNNLDILAEKIEKAKYDDQEMSRLISAYMPFIKKAAVEIGDAVMEYDDRLSLAMLTFMRCIKLYENDRGNFISFAAACIRNRLIDESRKQLKYSRNITPLFNDEDEKAFQIATDRASIEAYSLEQERESLVFEIEAFSESLQAYGISFQELPKICPKHDAARRRCVDLARYVAANEGMRVSLLKSRRLAQSSLARQFNLSEKTVEKHRKYIVTIVLLLSGDYPLVKAFLPQ